MSNPTMSKDVQSIRTLIAAREAAVAASDAKDAIANVAEGAVAYDLQPPLAIIHSADAAVADLEKWFATWRDGVTTVIDEPTVEVSGDLAVAYGLANMRGDKIGEGPTDMWYRSTIVLKRGADGWRIVHEHHSVPMAMDGSDLALTDLTPE